MLEVFGKSGVYEVYDGGAPALTLVKSLDICEDYLASRGETEYMLNLNGGDISRQQIKQEILAKYHGGAEDRQQQRQAWREENPPHAHEPHTYAH